MVIDPSGDQYYLMTDVCDRSLLVCLVSSLLYVVYVIRSLWLIAIESPRPNPPPRSHRPAAAAANWRLTLTPRAGRPLL